MKTRDCLALLGVAGATMAFTLGLFGPGQVGADSDAKGVKPTIAQPKLTVDGCVFELTTDQPNYAAGQAPVVTVVAANRTDKPVATTAWVGITAVSPASLMSRVVRAPTAPLWQGACRVNLAAGESKRFTFDTKAELPAGRMVMITMTSRNMAVIAERLSVLQPTGGSAGARVVQSGAGPIPLTQTGRNR